MSDRRPRLIAAPLALLALTALAGCEAPGTASAQEGTVRDAETAAHEAYPLTLDNCGTTVTFESAPQRVLAIKSTAIEMMLALGLDDRVVGTAFTDGAPAEEWAERAASLTVIDEAVPGPEATLTLEPDLVYAGWESSLTADGAGDRRTLASLGVASYVSPSACQEAEFQPERLTFDDVFGDIRELGKIFDVTDTARDLVASLRLRLDEIVPDDRGLTALWFSSGSDTPFVGGGIGAPQMMMDAVGLRNIAADVPDTWSSLSWEAIVDADPDVIVLIDSAWGSTAKKIGVLEANPATARLDAVREKRYVVVPFPASEAGVRNVEAVESIVAQLAELELG